MTKAELERELAAQEQTIMHLITSVLITIEEYEKRIKRLQQQANWLEEWSTRHKAIADADGEWRRMARAVGSYSGLELPGNSANPVTDHPIDYWGGSHLYW